MATYSRRGRKGRSWNKRQRARADKYRKGEDMAARKTAAERATERENARILGEYFDTHEAKKEHDSEDRRLKRAVELIPDGQWGSYLKTYGTPRLVMDQDAVRARFEELGETVPMKPSHPLIVRKV